MSSTAALALDLSLAPTNASATSARRASPLAAVQANPAARDTSLVQVTTLVLWSACALGGALGLWLHYAAPTLPQPAPEAVVVEKLNVELAPPTLTPIESSPAPASDLPPPPAALAAAPVPAAVPVAEPSSAIAFAIPVEGPVRIVAADQAAHTRYAAPANAVGTGTAAPAVQTLVFGQGEGRQPAPEYPPRALNAGQEGAVVVRLLVGANGRVEQAEAVQPSAWPLLNDAAVRTVRAYWRFSRGAVRAYEVVIRFQLPK
jgi:TonB family protein